MTDQQQYLLLYTTAPDGEPWSAEDDDIEDWIASADPIFGERLTGRADARAVTKRAGKVAVSDAPLPEFKEWFVGFDLVSAPDRDAAVEIGSRHPSARYGRVLVLPLMDAVQSNELLQATIRAREAAGVRGA